MIDLPEQVAELAKVLTAMPGGLPWRLAALVALGVGDAAATGTSASTTAAPSTWRRSPLGDG